MTFVERVQITNYKSIATCDVSLTPFNAAGRSERLGQEQISSTRCGW